MSELNDQIIGGRSLNEKFSNELYDFCQRLENEIGLRNGATALFWHLDATIGNHLKKDLATT